MQLGLVAAGLAGAGATVDSLAGTQMVVASATIVEPATVSTTVPLQVIAPLSVSLNSGSVVVPVAAQTVSGVPTTTTAAVLNSSATGTAPVGSPSVSFAPATTTPMVVATPNGPVTLPASTVGVNGTLVSSLNNLATALAASPGAVQVMSGGRSGITVMVGDLVAAASGAFTVTMNYN